MTAEEKPKRRRATGGKTGTRKKKKGAEERYLKIQEAAYWKAEKDGFRRDPMDYWLEAEKELDSVSD